MRWLAAVALLVFLAAIYLRGYLVPGTPELTERYVPPSVLRLFGKDLVSNQPLGELTTDDPWHSLSVAGIVDRSGDVPVLSAEFQEAFRREIDRRSETPTADDVADLVDATTIDMQGSQAFSIDGNRLLRWDSNTALLADVAAASVLRTRIDWSALERDERLEALRRIRLLLDRCPSCNGVVDRNSDCIDPCCQPPHISIWATCQACGDHIGDVTIPERKADSWTNLLLGDDMSTVAE
ncbi:hypothetical protein [Natronococcus wangiae]|uniref:hypothetical protein n=1 Tax=Natronococcus wangiae TaxID=3068275 RepID=UPI00273F05BA|nr:hypothetical protein [Natronococcus sp. AD5]